MGFQLGICLPGYHSAVGAYFVVAEVWRKSSEVGTPDVGGEQSHQVCLAGGRPLQEFYRARIFLSSRENFLFLFPFFFSSTGV
jgi:hypothetical protein